QPQADLLDGAHHEAVAGGAGHSDVELGVDAHVVRLAGGLAHRADRAPHRAHVGPVAGARRLGGHGGLEVAAVHEQLLELLALAQHARHQLLHRAGVLAGLAHEGAAAAASARLHEVIGLEQAHRVLDRGAADAEHRRQLALGRQRLARRYQPQRDLAADLLGHVLVRAELLDRLELDGRAAVLALPPARAADVNGHAPPPPRAPSDARGRHRTAATRPPWSRARARRSPPGAPSDPRPPARARA